MIPKAEPEGITELLENIPEELRQRPQWVVWKLEKRDDKPTKMPYIAGGVGKASTTDLLTWEPFEDALTGYESGAYDGIGFVFCSGDPYVGVDLDGCVDPETGEVALWAAQIIGGLDSYTELSPSGTGVHIISRGRIPSSGRRGSVEMYSQERFFTMTGHLIGESR
jgi:primase-polymerase (primpol)-like protein